MLEGRAKARSRSRALPGSGPVEPVRSRAWFARALEVAPGGVNSPVRAFRAVGGTPVFMASVARCTAPAACVDSPASGRAMSARARSSSRVTSCDSRAESAAMLPRNRERSCGLISSPWSCNSSTAPLIPASGVLNSWLTEAAKSRR